MAEERDRDVERLREALARQVRNSDSTQRSIEERNGFARGYLSQVLKGHITLTVRHLLGILKAIEQPPARFFAEFLDSPKNELAAMGEIRQRMARYDVALEELEKKGFLDPHPQEEPDP